MSTDKPMDGIISLSEPQNLEAIRLKYEHEQKTVWRRDILFTWAKALALVASAIGGAVAVCLVIAHKDKEMLSIIAPIYSGVLAFVGARLC